MKAGVGDCIKPSRTQEGIALILAQQRPHGVRCYECSDRCQLTLKLEIFPFEIFYLKSSLKLAVSRENKPPRDASIRLHQHRRADLFFPVTLYGSRLCPSP